MNAGVRWPTSQVWGSLRRARIQPGEFVPFRHAIIRLASVALGLAATALATAWQATEGPTLQLPERPHAMVAAKLKGAPVLVATSPKGTWVVQPRSGEVLYRSAQGGTSLMVREVEGTGFPQVLSCGPFGIHALDLGVDGFAEPRQLSDQACGRIGPLVTRGGKADADIATAGQGASAWIFKGSKLELVGSVSGLGDDVPMLASEGARVAAGGQGSHLCAPGLRRGWRAREGLCPRRWPRIHRRAGGLVADRPRPDRDRCRHAHRRRSGSCGAVLWRSRR